MKVCGYERNTENYVELREASIVCKFEELDKIIKFLNYAKNRHEGVIDHSDGFHSHYRDWDNTWKEDETDIIVINYVKE